MVGTHVHVRMSKDRNFMVGTHVQQFQLNFYGWRLCMQTGLAPMCNSFNLTFMVGTCACKQGWHLVGTNVHLHRADARCTWALERP